MTKPIKRRPASAPRQTSPAEALNEATTNRFGFPVQLCPGCGSLPAANGNLDDDCPRCGAWTFHCGIVALHTLPTEVGASGNTVYQHRRPGYWIQLPPSEVQNKKAFTEALKALSATDQPLQPIMSLSHLWEPYFPNYKAFRKIVVARSSSIRHEMKSRRLLVSESDVRRLLAGMTRLRDKAPSQSSRVHATPTPKAIESGLKPEHQRRVEQIRQESLTKMPGGK
jgi:hypothetical protein